MKRVRSLLIVDDNPADIVLTNLILEETSPGCFPCILQASNGEEALDLFIHYEESRRAHPDCFPPIVILLDINMPRMDGFEFLHEYAQLVESGQFAAAVVLMVTSSSQDRDRERALEYEFVRQFIVKPPKPEDVLEIVERFGE